jgi:Neuraminidase (sialidase)
MHWWFYGIPLAALVLSFIGIQAKLLSAQAATGMRGNPSKLVQLSQDPYTNTSDPNGDPAYHQTGYEPASYSFGSTIVSTFQLGRFNGGGSTNLGWATSIDGGKNWHTGLLSGTTVYAGGSHAAISNASVAYDPKHRVWLISYVFVDSSTAGGWSFKYGSATAVSRSFDGGLTWSAPTVVSTTPSGDFAYDKPWMSCDTSPHSPFYGHCYMLWNDLPQIDLSTSTDGGATWGAVKHSASLFNGVGGALAVQPNGTVVVVTPQNNEPPSLVAFTSPDGGQSWGSPVTIAAVFGGGFPGTFPSLAEDADGSLYVVWNGEGKNGTSTVLTRSTDGIHWTAPQILSTSYYDRVALAVDARTAGPHAHLGLTYYTTDTVTTPATIQPFFISSTDGGQQWSSAQALSKPMSVDWLVPNKRTVGDYISTVFSDGRAFPFFVIGMARGNNDPYHQEVYTLKEGIRC